MQGAFLPRHTVAACVKRIPDWPLMLITPIAVAIPSRFLVTLRDVSECSENDGVCRQLAHELSASCLCILLPLLVSVSMATLNETKSRVPLSICLAASSRTGLRLRPSTLQFTSLCRVLAEIRTTLARISVGCFHSEQATFIYLNQLWPSYGRKKVKRSGVGKSMAKATAILEKHLDLRYSSRSCRDASQGHLRGHFERATFPANTCEQGSWVSL